MNETSIETTKDISSLSLDMEPILNKMWEPEQIIKHVSEMTGKSIEELVGIKRQRDLVEARYIAIYLIRESMPGLALSKIGRMFNRDHSTIIYAIETVGDLIKHNYDFRITFNKIKLSV